MAIQTSEQNVRSITVQAPDANGVMHAACTASCTMAEGEMMSLTVRVIDAKAVSGNQAAIDKQMGAFLTSMLAAASATGLPVGAVVARDT